MKSKTALEILEEYDVDGLDSNDCDLYRIEDVLEAMETYASQSRWISVDEGLPEESGRFLCYYKTVHDKTPHISVLSWHNLLGFNGQFLVTHWMPLPEKP